MLPGGPSGRNPEVQRQYFADMEANKNKSNGHCVFCDLSDQTFVADEGEDWSVIKAKYPYELWEDMIVGEHLLAVPKRHVAGIEHLNEREGAGMVRLLGKYSLLGYSAYTRASNNIAKSVVHLHTHLLKFDTDKGCLASMNYSRNPHVVEYTMTGNKV